MMTTYGGCVRNAEVDGSNPFTSTISFRCEPKGWAH